jgi:redox-sensing transcriptional repressor
MASPDEVPTAAKKSPAEHALGDTIDALSASRIPKAVVRRLALYSRVLQRLEGSGVEKVSSEDLARLLGHKSAQVRKDLAYFGQFGTPGLGYQVQHLRHSIKRILGADRDFAVAVVGVGNLGRALLSYGGFAKQGYRMVCGFDLDPVSAARMGALPVPIFEMSHLTTRLNEMEVEIAILAVPVDAAQEVADRCAQSNIAGILNFVPTRIRVAERIYVHQVDLSLELESLGFYIR